MRNTTARSFVLFFVVAAYFVGMGFLIFGFAAHGSEWATNKANQHLYSNGQILISGSIYDTNGVVLAQSSNGKRAYNSNKTIRKATLHAVGDYTGCIATGVQYVYRHNLSGYDPVNGIYNIVKSSTGSDITLTIDAEICKTAYNALNGRKGTVGVYNYKTGEIVCMVSSPTYDPQNKPSDIETNDDYEGVYLNRMISGVYVPGSTFKIITAISALENIPDIESQTFNCDGAYETGDGVVKCNGVHGKISFEKALNESCNSAFAEIANELGKEKLQATAEELGFNQTISMDKINIKKSTFDVTKTSKTDLGWAGIGQYTTLVSPYLMMSIVGAIANNGDAIQPYLVASVKSSMGITTKTKATKFSQISVNSTIAAKMKKFLRSDVTNHYGDSKFPGLEMCGKTGTAQLDGKESHSWFVGFSQKEDSPYAIACVVENSGAGITAAGTVVNKVMQKLCN